MWRDDLLDPDDYPTLVRRTAFDHTHDPERRTLSNLTQPEMTLLLQRINEGQRVPVYARSIVSGLWHPALVSRVEIHQSMVHHELKNVNPTTLPQPLASSVAQAMTGQMLNTPLNISASMSPTTYIISNGTYPIVNPHVSASASASGSCVGSSSASSTSAAAPIIGSTRVSMTYSTTPGVGAYQVDIDYDELTPRYNYEVRLVEFPQVTITLDGAHLALRTADDQGAREQTRAALSTSFEEMLAARERGDWMP